jgi:hypothetical protein
LLDERIAPLHEELRPFAAADPRVLLLRTIPGIGELLGLTFAAEIGDVARFGSPRKLIGFAGLAPRVNQSGDRSRTGALSKPARGHCAGQPSKPPTRPGDPATRGMSSTPSSPPATARTRPSPPSHARS